MMACECDETYGPVSLASTASRGRVSLDGVDATVTGRRGATVSTRRSCLVALAPRAATASRDDQASDGVAPHAVEATRSRDDAIAAT